MVSKPTGRKRGRPRKPIPLRLNRDRGRPRVTLANDPYRWQLAVLEYDALKLIAATGCGVMAAHETLATWRHGKIERTPENLAKFANGQPYSVWMPEHKKFRISSDDTFTERQRDGWPWRNKNPFRPIADQLRKKLARYRKQDGARLDIMVQIWGLCLSGPPEAVNEARRLAASIGEGEHFENEMRPICFP